MVPHFIVNEQLNLVLNIDRDFNKTCTTLSLLKPTSNGFELIKEKQVGDLLNHAISIGNRFLVATMLVRKWGAPAYIEEWDWQNLELVKKHNIQEEKFGLMQFTVSPDATTLLIDRFWPPEKNSFGHSRIFSFPDFQELGRIELNSNLLSPVFDTTANKLLVVHTDQGGAEARLLVKQNGKFEEIEQFAMDEIGDDFTYTAMAFTSFGYLLLTLWNGKISFYLYDETSFDIKWKNTLEENYYREIESLYEKNNKSFDHDSFNTYLFNTDLSIYVNEQSVYFGGTGKIYQLDLATGNLKNTIVLDGLSLILQIRKLNNSLVAIDHNGQLAKTECTDK